MIPPTFIQELLARTDVVDVVGRRVTLKRSGSNYLGLCPFHEEKTPSFTVSPAKQFFHCFGCGAHGSALGFLMEAEGVGFVDAVRDLAGRAGLAVPEVDRSPQQARQAQQARAQDQVLREVMLQAESFYQQRLKCSARAVDYLRRRGLTGEVAARYHLGYAPDERQALATAFRKYSDEVLVRSGLVVARDAQRATIKAAGTTRAPGARRFDRLRDRIVFPIRNARGDLIGFGGRVLDKGEPKYINSPESALFHKGEELYGLFEARKAIQRAGYALVVEGYMDVIALAQHGVPQAVATLGTACTAQHMRKLFQQAHQLVFSFDGDTAGRKAAARALEAALPLVSDERGAKFLFLPPEHDPDSFVRANSAEAFEREVARALPLSVFLLETLAQGLAMSSAEGRAASVARARPLFALMPESALKAQILGEFAPRVALTTAELRAQLQPGDDQP